LSTQANLKPDVKPKVKVETPNDLYAILQKSIDEYFSQIKINAMSYLQAISDLQEEIIQFRKNNANTMVTMHKNITKDFDFNSELPPSISRMADTLVAQGREMWSFQNKLLLTSIEEMSKNIQAFNDNAKTFSDIHQQILSSWASMLKQKHQESKSN